MRKRRSSRVLATAEARLEGLLGIRPDLDLGHGLGVKALTTATGTLSASLVKYNHALAAADEARVELMQQEDAVRDLSDRTLAAVAGRYGRDSVEYSRVGGTRTSDRKRHRRTPAKGTDSPAATAAAGSPGHAGNGVDRSSGSSG